LAGLLVLAALSSPPGLDPTKPATLAGDAMTTASAATGAIGISPGDFDVARFLLWYAAALLLFTGLNLAWILPPRPAPAFAIAIAIASEETRDAGVASPPIVFFDGVCGLCNTAVDFILAEDRPGIFRYAPLQGETAARLLSPEAVADMDSMVFRDARGEFHTRSEAILRIGIQMGGLWRLGAPGLLIPRALRDRLYSTIAKNRYRWFGKKESCRMPTPKERELFLM
ncbi:MAG: DCC1-like thiol-disulfide oxidoreductase family protein, partial [Leptospirales bacterium]